MKIKEGDVVCLCDEYYGLVDGYELPHIKYKVVRYDVVHDRGLVTIINLENGIEKNIHYSWLRGLKYHRNRQIGKII